MVVPFLPYSEGNQVRCFGTIDRVDGLSGNVQIVVHPTVREAEGGVPEFESKRPRVTLHIDIVADQEIAIGGKIDPEIQAFSSA